LKSTKLFAIITLVAFMMMLVPMAAFATVTNDRFASVGSIEKTSLPANSSDTSEITIYTYNSDNILQANQKVYFASSRGATDTFIASDTGTFDATLGYIMTDSTGKGTFKVKSSVPGTSKIALAYAANQTAVQNYLDGVDSYTASAEGVIDRAVFDVTFTAPGIDHLVVSAVAASEGTTLGTGTSDDPYAVSTVNGNGVDYFEFAFKVLASNNAPIANQDVTFSADKPELTFAATTVTTDAAGIAKVKAYASKPGTYVVKGAAGDKDWSVSAKYAANDLYNIALVSDDNQVIGKDGKFTIKWKLSDAAGNGIDAIAATDPAVSNGDYVYTNDKIKIDAITRPSGAAMNEHIAGSGLTDTYYAFTKTTEGYLQLVINKAEIDTEGAYAIKAWFESGKSATINFTVKKQGTATKLTVAYDQVSIALGAKTGTATVKRVDDANVAMEVENYPDIVFTANDVNKIGSWVGNQGQFYAATDDKYCGDIVITAVDTNKNLAASTTIKLAKAASGITLTGPAAVTPVGTSANVVLQVVDVDGKPVSISKAATAVDATFYVTSKPSGAIVTTSHADTILDDSTKTGAVSLSVGSNVAGSVTVQVVLDATIGGSHSRFTKDVTLSFGAPKVVIGAKAITMFIGAKGYVQDGVAKVSDAAPFIDAASGRTFVPFRAIGEALGFVVSFDAATNTVSMTRSDMTLSLVVGGSSITKVAAGVTTTIAIDAPAQLIAGRTYVPFRAVGEATGATVSYDAVTGAVSIAQ